MEMKQKNLGEIVIEYTENFIKSLGNTNNSFSGEELLKIYKTSLKETIENYREVLNKEQSDIQFELFESEERVAKLLRSIVITYELAKIDQLIEERYNAK